jgi:transcriptional regulator with XRE-family HTH domain
MRGHRLKSARERQGLSQEDLATRIGTNKNQILRYEKELNDPTSEVLRAMAQELDVSTDYLLGLVDEPTEHAQEKDLAPIERRLLSAFRRGDFRELMAISAQAGDVEEKE